MISSSRVAELQHVPPAWKFCAAQAKSVSIAEMFREPTAGSGKPRRGHEKHCPAARIEATKKKQAREEPSRGHPQGPRGSGSAPRLPSWGCAGAAGCPAASATPGGCQSAWLRRWGHVLRPTRGSSSPRRCPRRSRTRPSIQTWIRAAKQI